MSYSALLEEINKLTVAERLALVEEVTHKLREELALPKKEAANLTPAQIRALPMEERHRILAAAAQLAIPDYQPGGELTEFTYNLEGEDIYDYDER